MIFTYSLHAKFSNIFDFEFFQDVASQPTNIDTHYAFNGAEAWLASNVASDSDWVTVAKAAINYFSLSSCSISDGQRKLIVNAV